MEGPQKQPSDVCVISGGRNVGYLLLARERGQNVLPGGGGAIFTHRSIYVDYVHMLLFTTSTSLLAGTYCM